MKTAFVKLITILLLLLLAGCAANGRRSMERGKQYMEQKDYKRALIEWKNAYRHFPKDAEVVYQLAMTYIANGDLPTGIQYLQLATKLDPKHVNAQIRLSELMALNRNDEVLQEAERRAQAALAADTTNAEAAATLAFAELRLGKTDVALKRLEDAIKASPKALKASLVLANVRLNKGDLPGAEELLKKAQEANPKSWEAWFALARYYMMTQRLDDAVVATAKVLEIDALSEMSLSDMAALKMTLKKPSEAEQYYKRLAAHPSHKYDSIHAIFLFQTGRTQEGLAELEKLHNSNKSDRTIRNQLVAGYLSLNRRPDAEKILTEAIKANARDADALLQRAELRMLDGKLDSIEADLGQVLKFKPDSGEAHYLLSRLHRIRNDFNNQERELYEALKFNPKILVARLDLAQRLIAKNGAKAALDLLDSAPDEQKNSVQIIAQRNWALLSLGRMDEFQKGIEKGYQLGRTPEFLLQDAIVRLRSRQFKAGRALLEEAIKANPNDLRVAQALAESHVAENKDVAGALAELKKQADAHPESPRLQHLYGNWLVLTGKPEEGRQAFLKAKAADVNYTGADMAMAQVDLIQGNLGQARSDLANVLKVKPDEAGATLLLAMIDEKAGRSEEAISSYRKVVTKEPGNMVALNNLAYRLAVSHGASDEALQLAQKAKEMAPNNPAVDDTLGWAYYQKNLYPSAVKQLEIATAGTNPSPIRLYHLAMAYQKAGNTAKARQTFDRAYKIAPAIPEADLAKKVIGIQ